MPVSQTKKKSNATPTQPSTRVAKAIECVKKQCSGIDKILPLYRVIQSSMQDSELSQEEMKKMIETSKKILKESKSLPKCVFVDCGQHMALAVDEILETIEKKLNTIQSDEKAQKKLLVDIQKRRSQVMSKK